MPTRLRSRRAAGPDIAAAGSSNVDPGVWREESLLALNANPGKCCEELSAPAPVTSPIGIASPQTAIAVIHAIRTATSPITLASALSFT